MAEDCPQFGRKRALGGVKTSGRWRPMVVELPCFGGSSRYILRSVMKVFLSSTAQELVAHRRVADDTILRLSQEAVVMERFGPLPGAPVAESEGKARAWTWFCASWPTAKATCPKRGVAASPGARSKPPTALASRGWSSSWLARLG